MPDPERILAAYDEQLRAEAEIGGAVALTRHGPLLLLTLTDDRGFVTYRDLDGADAAGVRGLVAAAVRHFTDSGVVRFEWKTRGHDHAPGLVDALLEHGFAADAPESIMLGEARSLAVVVALPDGVTLRRVTAAADVRAMCAMQCAAFGSAGSAGSAEALLRRLRHGDPLELWVAEAQGRVVCAGRVEPVPDSEFAGIWGGATLEPWRGRGIYRALTAARARSALDAGKTLIHSDSTEHSRPILERSGLVKASTTTPYQWQA